MLKNPANLPYPEINESSQHPHTLFVYDPIKHENGNEKKEFYKK
jgi:hypothetical protein